MISAPVSALHRMFTSLLFILLTTWLILLVIFYFFQERMVFFPSRGHAASPATVGLAFDDVYLQTADGVRIHGWYVPHPAPVAHLLFLHGNAGNISHRLDSLALFHQLGLAVLIIDYRGYGHSEGIPTETGTYRDARAAWDYLTNDRGVRPGAVILFGRSLGGAVAAWLAGQVSPAALILESTFTSVKDIGRHHYPYMPVSLIARLSYDTESVVRSLSVPLLVVHSRDDELVPFVHGQKLHDAATGEKRLLVLSGDHNSGFLQSRDTYLHGMAAFLRALDLTEER